MKPTVQLPFDGVVFPAPMAGVSDGPFRRICRRMGAGCAYTEFVSADLLARRDRRALGLFRFEPEERPIIFQIFGGDVDTVARAGRVAEELGPDVLDLNMGCSVRHISQKGCGAGLLRNPRLAGEMIAELRKVSRVPVTAKMRLGWDESARNYLEVARILEDSGAAMLSVHGRTKAQAYSGEADWNAIGEIKARAGIPVLGNGDVQSYRAALEKIRLYGVDGVLVGRGAMGNPWLFAGRDRATVSPSEVIGVLLKHFDDMLDWFEPGHGLVMFRKHARAYLAPFALEAQTLRRVLTTNDPVEFRDLVAGLRLENGDNAEGGFRAA